MFAEKGQGGGGKLDLGWKGHTQRLPGVSVCIGDENANNAHFLKLSRILICTALLKPEITFSGH